MTAKANDYEWACRRFIAVKVERIKLKRSLVLFPLFLLREKQGGVLGAAPLREIQDTD